MWVFSSSNRLIIILSAAPEFLFYFIIHVSLSLSFIFILLQMSIWAIPSVATAAAMRMAARFMLTAHKITICAWQSATCNFILCFHSTFDRSLCHSCLWDHVMSDKARFNLRDASQAARWPRENDRGALSPCFHFHGLSISTAIKIILMSQNRTGRNQIEEEEEEINFMGSGRLWNQMLIDHLKKNVVFFCFFHKLMLIIISLLALAHWHIR